MKFAEIEENVKNILKDNKGARDSDKALILEYIFCHSILGNLPIKYRNLIAKAFYTELPSMETITRRRRKIQSNGLYVAKDSTVSWRKQKSKTMKALMK